MTGKPYALGGADLATAPLRVMLIPHAGAGASSALVFRQHLPQDWVLAAIRLPGRESRIREAVPDLAGLVADVVASARMLPGRGPLLVVGVCSGAVVGLEAVRALQDTDPGLVAGFVAVSQWALNEQPDAAARPPADPDDYADVREELRAYGALPDSIADDDMLRTYLPVIAGDMRAVRDHYAAPEPALACPVLVVAGDHDPLCDEDRLAGWSLYSKTTRQVRVPGGHMLLAEAPAQLAGCVAANLDLFR
ncbi:thioesterase domain-containing protein [Streptomyces caniferus]|uniref:thioesterase II family protein n=1 Tax=Streptomyces caniferus TaxID=285557 RepID=UPI002E2D2AD8|nr:alpha/beta fold hydrolase [Streptomyces caniferus]